MIFNLTNNLTAITVEHVNDWRLFHTVRFLLHIGSQHSLEKVTTDGNGTKISGQWVYQHETKPIVIHCNLLEVEPTNRDGQGKELHHYGFGIRS